MTWLQKRRGNDIHSNEYQLPWRNLTVFILSSSLVACANLPGFFPKKQTTVLAQKYIIQADAHEKEQNWVAARQSWQIADAIKPQDVEIKSRLQRLQEFLHKRSDVLYMKAKRDYKKGDLDSSRSYLLRVLNIMPDLKPAQNLLKEVEFVTASRNLDKALSDK